VQVVSKTSPISYLLRIDGIGILENLYGRIVIPGAVIVELDNVESPNIVRNWAARPRDWVVIRVPTRELGWQLSHLGAGEWAISTTREALPCSTWPGWKCASAKFCEFSASLHDGKSVRRRRPC
jgi:hypothetical protein